MMGGKRIEVPNVHMTWPGNSHAIRAGNTIFLSGQVPLTPDDQLPGDGGFEAQTIQVFENIRNTLAAAGASISDVVKINAYIVDPRYFPAWREVRSRYLGDHRPAITGVCVVALADPRYLIEVEVVAVVA